MQEKFVTLWKDKREKNHFNPCFKTSCWKVYRNNSKCSVLM